LETEGWILDAYAVPGEMVVWVKKPDGEAVRLTDRWSSAIYASADSRSSLDYLAKRSDVQPFITSAEFVLKREHVFDYHEREVLRLVLRNANEAERLAKTVERCAGPDEYRIYNADLLPGQVYFIEKDLFPLARIRAVKDGDTIQWTLLDSNMAADYELPPLRRAHLKVEVDASGAIPKFTDPIERVKITTNNQVVEITEGTEGEKILSTVRTIAGIDPDLLFIDQGDDFTTHYLAERAYANGISDKLILGRDPAPLRRLTKRGTSYWAYNRVLHTPTSHQIFGRINLDAENFFVYSECGLDGLFEVVRLCRMPIHKGSRASIGKCLSSLQAYIAFKDNLLIPWKPTRAEVPKTGKTLLLGDRGGFIYEPRVGVHEQVGEVDFSSLFPFIMKKFNISAETILCRCCPDSAQKVPDVEYNLCEKRRGIIPRSLEPMLYKRMTYKRLKKEISDPAKAKVYASRADALKGLGVCSFGYLSYRNAKFGLIDCHISVCAFARKILLDTSRIAERRGFEVIHGIVDSLWVKKPRARKEDFEALCTEIQDEIGLPISFEGIYRWVAFLPSRMHEDVPVLNRYFGVFQDGSMKIRGIEARRRDTIKLVSDCQKEILELFATAEDVEDVRRLIPKAIEVFRGYVHLIWKGKIPISDLVIVNGLSKNWNEYGTNLPNVSAIKQLAEEGLELMAGQSVSYVVTNYRSKVQQERVRPVELLDESVSYDKERYTEILARGVASILEPFGVDKGELCRLIGIRQL
jgi:DNA polymerase elongation subunit (family B)